ncbi:MAG: ArdC family protein [Acidimicrobiales bacterium]
MNYTDHTNAVTTRLVDMIRTGAHGQWVMPWHTHGAAGLFNTRNAITGTPYTGANTIALFLDALERGFPTADYATFNAYRNAGAQVRKGERAAYITKWVTPTSRTDTDTADSDGDTGRRRLVPKVYAVFNAHQVDGHTPQPSPTTGTAADEWLAAIGADVVYGGDRAYYSPAVDRIYLPHPDQFRDADAFLATSLHEHVHFSGHRSRLDRLDPTATFASPAYATEELIAELGAAIAAARLGITTQPRDDHAAYLAHWIELLDEDPKILFRTATAAQRAVDHLDALATATTGSGSGSEEAAA